MGKLLVVSALTFVCIYSCIRLCIKGKNVWHYIWYIKMLACKYLEIEIEPGD